MRKIYKNKFIMSKYRLIVAKMYSSGDKCSIMSFVSTMINKEKIKAPPRDSNISKACDCRKIWIAPPTMRIKSPAKSLGKIKKIVKIYDKNYHIFQATLGLNLNFEIYIFIPLLISCS